MSFKGAVIGRTEVGKTALINSLLELYDHEDIKLKEIPNRNPGDVVTTKSPHYCLELAELPDPSYLSFRSKARYSSKFDLKDYHFFIIFVEVRTQESIETDKWLINHIKNELRKPYFLVLLKVDGFIKNNNKGVDKLTNEKKTAITLFELTEALKKNYPEEKVYLIGRERPNSSHNLEFDDLCEKISNFRKTETEMPPEDSWFDEIKLKVHNYAVNTENVGNSLEDYSAHVLEIMKEEESPAVHGCVIGVSGAGKSSLINSFIGKYVAPEGVTQTTLEPKVYEIGESCLSLTDLPGVGTKEFPKEKYSSQFELYKYDFIIIVIKNSKDSATVELNRWLQKHVIKEMKRPCYVVQSFFDQTVESTAIQKYPKCQIFTAEQLQEAEDEAAKNVKKRFNDDPLFFLIGKDIDNPARHVYEFDKLKDKIASDMPTYMQDCLLKSADEFTEGWIELKTKLLTKYMVKFCAVSTAVSACPVPGPSIAVDIALLTLFAKRCKDVYRLSEEALMTMLPPETVALFIGRIAAAIASTLALFTAVSIVDDTLKVVPIVGLVVSVATSGPMLYFAMTSLRKAFVQILKAVLEARAKREATIRISMGNSTGAVELKNEHELLYSNEKYVQKNL